MIKKGGVKGKKTQQNEGKDDEKGSKDKGSGKMQEKDPGKL